MKNHNICEDCIKAERHPSIVVADTGVCGACSKVKEVWDLAVINLYKWHKLSDEFIWKHLPRLRSNNIGGERLEVLCMNDINSKLSDLLAHRD